MFFFNRSNSLRACARSPATRGARGVKKPKPSSIDEGAGKAGCRSHPWPPCVKKCTGQEPQVRAGHSGLPCAMGLRLIRDLPGAPGFLATVTRVMPRNHPSIIANLTPASGCQDHTISPSAALPVVCAFERT